MKKWCCSCLRLWGEWGDWKYSAVWRKILFVIHLGYQICSHNMLELDPDLASMIHKEY